jgi:hypothetical protein
MSFPRTTPNSFILDPNLKRCHTLLPTLGLPLPFNVVYLASRKSRSSRTFSQLLAQLVDCALVVRSCRLMGEPGRSASARTVLSTLRRHHISESISTYSSPGCWQFWNAFRACWTRRRSRPVTHQICRTISPATIENTLCLCRKRDGNGRGSQGQQVVDEAARGTAANSIASSRISRSR